MKVVVFGCQQIAVDFIEGLLGRAEHSVPLVVTHVDPVDAQYGYASVAEWAAGRDLAVRSPAQVTDELVDEVRAIEPDILFSVYYRRILPPALIGIPRLGAVNIHPSPLPEYRGPTPTAWALLNGETDFGITIHRIDEGIDTGGILAQEQFPIDADETGFELHTRTMAIGAAMLERNLDPILAGELEPRPQEGIGSYYGRKSPYMDVDWQRPAEQIRNAIRVHAPPFNPVRANVGGTGVLLNRASRHVEPGYACQGPGRVLRVTDDDRLVVSCVDGCLMIEDYELVPGSGETGESQSIRPGDQFEF